MQSNHFWLLQASDPNAQSLNNLELRLDSNVLMYNWLEDNTIILDEAYRVSKSMDLTINPVGLWHPKARLVLTNIPFWERRRNLGGLQLVGGVLHVTKIFDTIKAFSLYNFTQDPPYDKVANAKNGDLFVTGLVIDIWQHFEETLNFT